MGKCRVRITQVKARAGKDARPQDAFGRAVTMLDRVEDECFSGIVITRPKQGENFASFVVGAALAISPIEIARTNTGIRNTAKERTL
jgi:hypothetical protein